MVGKYADGPNVGQGRGRGRRLARRSGRRRLTQDVADLLATDQQRLPNVTVPHGQPYANPYLRENRELQTVNLHSGNGELAAGWLIRRGRTRAVRLTDRVSTNSLWRSGRMGSYPRSTLERRYAGTCNRRSLGAKKNGCSTHRWWAKSSCSPTSTVALVRWRGHTEWARS